MNSEEYDATKCPICFSSLDEGGLSAGAEIKDINCSRCGNYKISRRAAIACSRSEKLKQEGSRERANLSSWLRERQPTQILNDRFLLEGSNDVLAQEFWATKPPSFHQKADKLLKFLREQTEYAGHTLDWASSKDEYIARSWSRNKNELSEIMRYLSEEKRTRGGVITHFLAHGGVSYESRLVKIEPAGWAHLEELKKSIPATDQAFIAMWFDEQMDNAWANAIMPAIGDAGYYPQRIDMKQHNNKIDDELIAEIRKSKFLVADLTGHRGGVYYEAGFAHGLGLQVIWSCRDTDFNNLHFDVRQYACIKWNNDDLINLRNDLKNKIEATLGRGNYVPPKTD